MTKAEVKQQYKNEALNSIAKLYDKDGFKSDRYDYESSHGEQRDYEVKSIISIMNQKIFELNKKHLIKNKIVT